LVAPSDRQANIESVPGARDIVLSETGHFAALEAPDDVARILLEAGAVATQARPPASNPCRRIVGGPQYAVQAAKKPGWTSFVIDLSRMGDVGRSRCAELSQRTR
jgi:hypothetical protein